MKEFIIKMVIGMVINSIPVENIIKAIEKLKMDLINKVGETESQWDDMAVAAFLSSEDQVLDLLMMLNDMVDEKVKESPNKTDDIIWLPLSAKMEEVIKEVKK